MIQRFHPPERGFLKRPRSLGDGTLDMHRISPGEFTLEKITGTAESLIGTNSEQLTLDCKHFAAAQDLTQRQIGVALCKNC
jgi:hypothetical protein